MALGKREEIFSLHYCIPSLVRASIMFYVEYRQSDICCFKDMTLPLQWVWN